MDKMTLELATITCREETKTALQIVYDALNKGQQNKLLKNESVKALFDFYEIVY